MDSSKESNNSTEPTSFMLSFSGMLVIYVSYEIVWKCLEIFEKKYNRSQEKKNYEKQIKELQCRVDRLEKKE